MKRIKKLTAIIMCIAMLLTAIPMAAFAAEERAVVSSGFCGEDGENLAWTLYDDGELVISGEGRMDWYDVENSPSSKLPPWLGYYDKIDVITVEEGVTSIGRHAFSTGFEGGGHNPTGYYRMNLPKSLEFVEDNMFYDIGKNRIPGKHLAYCYAGSEEEWEHVLIKLCSITLSDNGPVERTYRTGVLFDIGPESEYEKLYFNGEEPQAFCELVRSYGDIDIVTHYYAPEAAKIEWYAVNEGSETKVGENSAKEHEAVKIELPNFEKGDVYLKAKIVDADSNVIVSSENLWIGDASIKEPTFFDKVKMYFRVMFFELQLIGYIIKGIFEYDLIPYLFELWMDELIWWK